MTKIILYFLLCGSILDAEDFRKWTSKDGRIIDAKFIKFFDEKVEIQRKDGRSFRIDKSTF